MTAALRPVLDHGLHSNRACMGLGVETGSGVTTHLVEDDQLALDVVPEGTKRQLARHQCPTEKQGASHDLAGHLLHVLRHGAN